jgi:DNA-directed RNA polymerase specialized sigma24 family protein
VDALRTGEASAASAQDLDALIKWLREWAGATLRISDADAADASQEAVIALLERTLDPSGDPVRNPAAFLTWLTRNRAIDRLRAQTRHSPEPLETATARLGGDDEAIARLLDHAATTDRVEAALRVALERDDALTVRVVTIWLDEAEATGAPPASRQIASRAGVSHTTVNQALRRFRGYFPSEGARTSPE